MRRSPLKILAALGAVAVLGFGLAAVVAPTEGLAQHRSLLRVGPNEPPRQIKLHEQVDDCRAAPPRA